MKQNTDIILDRLEKTPAQSISQLVKSTHLSKSSIQSALEKLLCAGLVGRDGGTNRTVVYFLTPQNALSEKSVRFNEARALALELEERGLWLRAARQWLITFDLAQSDREREDISRRRLRCINNGKLVVEREYFL